MHSTKRSTSSLLISLITFLSAALLFASAILITLTTFLPLFSGKELQTQSVIFGFGFGFEALLLFAATYFCFQKYNLHSSADLEVRFQLKGWHIIILILSTCVALLIGYFVAENKSINWLLLPVLTIPAVALPIGLIFGFGAHKIQLGPRWRVWGIFGLGMTLGPFLLLLIEIFILILLFVLVIFFLISQPEYSNEIIRLSNQIQFMRNDPQAIINLFIPYLFKPGSIILMLSFIAVIVPLTEELIKPIGVWLYAGKLNSPAQGFALGALSGAAYALVETIGTSGQTADWATLLLIRIGTALLHITSTALMGWGIASVWKQRQYLKLFAIYLCSSALHGVWNASAIMYSYSLLATEFAPSNLLSSLAPFTLSISVAWVGVLLTILILANKRLNQMNANEQPVENAVNAPV